MKIKVSIFLVVAVCLFFGYNKVMANVNENSVYSASIVFEYREGDNTINRVIYQDFEIYNNEDEKIYEGRTDENGVVEFSYSAPNYSVSEGLEIKIILYPSNESCQVIDSTNSRNYIKELVLEPYEYNEINVLIDGESGEEDENVYKSIKVSQYALYSKLTAEKYIDEEVDSVDIYIDDETQISENFSRISSFAEPNRINIFNYDIATFAHEYGHYISYYFDLVELYSIIGHGTNGIKLGCVRDEGIYTEMDNMKCAIAEGFATFYGNLTIETILEDFENVEINIDVRHKYGLSDLAGFEEFNNNYIGELNEKNLTYILWDLIDDTPAEESINMSVQELFTQMSDLHEDSGVYSLNELFNYLIANDFAEKSDIIRLCELNGITQPIIFDNYEENIKIYIELYYYEGYRADEYVPFGDGVNYYLFDRYILHIYEKVNGQFVELNESFEIGYVNEENIVDIDGKLFFVYEFDNSLMQYINDNMFKELYFTVEQINYIEDNYMVTSYETPFQNLVILNSGTLVKDIDFEIDTNYYTWLAYKASVTMDYNIYSEGSADVMCMVYEDIEDNNSLICGNDNKDGEDVNFLINVRLHEDEIVYLKILFPSRGEGTTVYIEPDLNVTGYLLIDSPLYAVHGTEVTLNNGEYNGLTITSGLSRIAYIPQGNWSTSRLDYDWSSSNKNVLTVSIYGTLQALKVEVNTSVIVTAVNKNNPDIIFIQNLTIQPDDTDEIRDISINMNLNLNESEYINLNNLCPNPILQSYEWHSSDEDIVDVTYYGLVTRKQAGEAVVYGTYLYNENYIVIINIS